MKDINIIDEIRVIKVLFYMYENMKISNNKKGEAN